MILVMAHAYAITTQAMILSLVGGAFVYSTILGYIHYFSQEESY